MLPGENASNTLLPPGYQSTNTLNPPSLSEGQQQNNNVLRICREKQIYRCLLHFFSEAHTQRSNNYIAYSLQESPEWEEGAVQRTR